MKFLHSLRVLQIHLDMVAKIGGGVKRIAQYPICNILVESRKLWIKDNRNKSATLFENLMR